MKALKIIAIVSSLVFVVSFGAGIAFMAAACKEGLPDIENYFNDNSFAGEVNEDQTLSADAEGMTDLSVNVDASKIELVRENREDVKVDYSSQTVGTGSNQLTVERNGETVNIESKARHFFTCWKGIYMTVRIPQNYNGKLSLDIGASSLSISGQQQFSDVVINVGAGNVSIDDLQADTVKADVSVGKLSAKHMNVSSLILNVGTGDADISGLTGSTDLTVNMGKASLEYDRLAGNITADVQAGDASLRIPSDASATLDLTADMGSVSQTFGSRFSGDSSDNSINGVLNNGGNRISGKVSMGNLTVENR